MNSTICIASSIISMRYLIKNYVVKIHTTDLNLTNPATNLEAKYQNQ